MMGVSVTAWMVIVRREANISFHELMPFRGGLRWLADAALSHYISSHQQKSTKSLIQIALISFKIIQSILS